MYDEWENLKGACFGPVAGGRGHRICYRLVCCCAMCLFLLFSFLGTMNMALENTSEVEHEVLEERNFPAIAVCYYIGLAEPDPHFLLKSVSPSSKKVSTKVKWRKAGGSGSASRILHQLSLENMPTIKAGPYDLKQDCIFYNDDFQLTSDGNSLQALEVGLSGTSLTQKYIDASGYGIAHVFLYHPKSLRTDPKKGAATSLMQSTVMSPGQMLDIRFKAETYIEKGWLNTEKSSHTAYMSSVQPTGKTSLNKFHAQIRPGSGIHVSITTRPHTPIELFENIGAQWMVAGLLIMVCFATKQVPVEDDIVEVKVPRLFCTKEQVRQAAEESQGKSQVSSNV
eukprot:TRINITY_DN80760_c0_g1_i1.p1 TRINITY_DN80760_c0_g1~~TRINITY_DN80760_c0_g1_i1.p1  ORF type:complete len:339 (-),score=49.25 TRINITY_DN80760_c0_g1_i1:502-1518(-)